jgi:hypothetical protein
MKQALAICKRAGLTIVATDSGFASVPVERMDATPRTVQTDDNNHPCVSGAGES